MRRIGTAGWSVPGNPQSAGTHLQRYSQTLSCVEVNSSFYRQHRENTWRKWAEETPAGFRFSVKAPRAITHTGRLRGAEPLLNSFFAEISHLGDKQGPVLFQLPPSLDFDIGVAKEFLIAVRERYQSEAALEPRHPSWFSAKVDDLLREYKIARVAADPPKGGVEAGEPGGYTGLAYYRLHGLPLIYYSNYDDGYLAALATRLRSHEHAWVIFDNTALARAYVNALQLDKLLVT